MIGEDKSTSEEYFQGVNCYSSSNLVEWSFEDQILSPTTDGVLGPERILERPKVIYNERTKKYIMWAHLDDLATRKNASVGVAISDSVCGRYTFLATWRPLGFQSRDIGLFKDDDGSAYLLTEDVSQHNDQKNLRLPR